MVVLQYKDVADIYAWYNATPQSAEPCIYFTGDLVRKFPQTATGKSFTPGLYPSSSTLSIAFSNSVESDCS